MEFKLSTLVIIVTIAVAAMATSASWIAGINEEYPSANLDVSWNTSFNKMAELNSTGASVREAFGVGEKEGGIETSEGTDVGLFKGTISALSNAKETLELIPSMIRDFMDNSKLDLPWWFYSTIWTIILVSVLFTLAGAFLRRIP